MAEGPLVAEQIEDGAGLIRAFDRFAPVRVAFWAKEDGYWYLHLASDRIDDANLDAAHDVVLDYAATAPGFDPFRVKVCGADDRVAGAVVAAREKQPGPRPLRARDQSFGGLYADEVYVYPSAVAAAG